MTYHHSSFDQMVIVGSLEYNIVSTTTSSVVSTVTFSTTYTEAASISSSIMAFSVVILLALIAVAVPVITYFVRPRTK